MTMRNVTILAAIISVSSFAFAAEKSIRRSDLPPAVENALQQQINGATVKGFTTETENGRQTYEAALMVDGHTKDIEFDRNGNIQEVEEEVAFETLSPQVKAALTTKARAGMVKKVESLRKQDKLVAYEAQVEKAASILKSRSAPVGKHCIMKSEGTQALCRLAI